MTAPLTGKRILVVEDESILSMLLEEALTDEGASVVGPAASLEAALSLASQADLDAAILDVNLAGVESYPVAELLEQRRVPYVFATAYSRNSNDKLVSARMIRKPYALRELIDALRAMVT
ncbi:MAG: response regulator [Pseudomonadota bacterium]|nr:response regulator [Pseudomonadota bacterium]